MSTRSNIIILLKPEDRDKVLVCPDNENYTANPHGKCYLSVYCHNDGYPDGVGEALINMFNPKSYNSPDELYKDILNYILKGDRSTTDLSYIEWRNASWEDVIPSAEDDVDSLCSEDFAYLYDYTTNRWMFTEYDCPDWEDLVEYLTRTGEYEEEDYEE